jgi:uncharacterized protein
MIDCLADTGYWWAISKDDDSLHDDAIIIGTEIRRTHRMVTTDAILFEWLNALARFGPTARFRAAKLLREIRQSSAIVIVPITTALFDQALSLYERSMDKAWSLTDCASFIVMRERKIQDALTYDHHFEQAGFRALLRSH